MKSDFTVDQLDILENALHALTVCEDHFRLRDKANAQLHLATPKYSPITRMVGKAVRDLTSLLPPTSSPDETSSEHEGADFLEVEPPPELIDQMSE